VDNAIDLTNYVTDVDFFDAVADAKSAARTYSTKTHFETEFVFRSLQMGHSWMQIIYPPREELLERLNNTLKGRKNGDPWNWSGIKNSDRIDNKGKYPL
jgi:hypothetical protein